ncbi:hypothetical protein A9266_12900 [Vibrio tasmaniensis]|nr:hypothetical protein A9266_12900 [Vibrio tasmaniensis]
MKSSQSNSPLVSTIIRVSEVKALTGLSHATLYRLISQNKFPAQLELGARCVGWRRHEVQEWIDTRPNVNPMKGAK